MQDSSGATTPPRQWVTKDMFEAQLELATSRAKDPNAGLFGPGSMMWRVGKRGIINLHGSGRALLLQIAHPWVTRGIDDHSITRADPLRRGARTFRAILSIVFGSVEQATAQARKVHDIHSRVHGKVGPDSGAFREGSHYQANEVHSMIWVHATLWDTSIRMHELFAGPLTRAEKNQYYDETRLFAYMFGIPDDMLPPNWDEFMEYNRRMWDSDLLVVNAATQKLARFLYAPVHPAVAAPTSWLKLVTAATMPERLREEFGFTFDRQEQARFRWGVRGVKVAERLAPSVARYGPFYIEAQRRLKGKGSTPLTRKLNRAMLGRDELVALAGASTNLWSSVLPFDWNYAAPAIKP